MPNHYVTVDELKDAAPDAIKSNTTQYNEVFYELARKLSRWIDNHTEREFFPAVETRTFTVKRRDHHRHGSHLIHGSHLHGGHFHDHVDIHPSEILAIDDIIEITTVSVSEDDGATYTALASTDFIPMRGNNDNTKKSYDTLLIDRTGTQSSWPIGQKSVKVLGTWGMSDDRSRFFEDTLDEVEDNPLAANGLSLTLNDVDGVDQWNLIPRVSPGQILRIESEFIEVVATDTSSGAQSATIVRGRNGTTGASHAQNTQIDKFMPPEPVKQACLIQTKRAFKRAQISYIDAEAIPDFGSIQIVKNFDPEAIELLKPYKQLGYGDGP